MTEIFHWDGGFAAKLCGCRFCDGGPRQAASQGVQRLGLLLMAENRQFL
jgi:hypothetical protein